MDWRANPEVWIALATLTAPEFRQHIPKGYIYFAMAFSVFVEAINLRVRARTDVVRLRWSLQA